MRVARSDLDAYSKARREGRQETLSSRIAAMTEVFGGSLAWAFAPNVNRLEFAGHE
ncbi:MAG: hypothetical protein ACREN1_08375 [Candidatus Dormibacteria bacterium]